MSRQELTTPPQAKGLNPQNPATANAKDISGGLFSTIVQTIVGELKTAGDNRNSQTDSPENLGTVTKIDSGGEFNLIVEDEGELSINNLSPSNLNVLSGQDLVMRVRGSGGPDLSYQWFHNDTPIDGAISEELFLSDLSPADNGNYTVKAFSGDQEVTSEPKSISVLQEEATIEGTTVRAVKGIDGKWLFSILETDPPGLELEFRLEETQTLPFTSGTFTVTAELIQNGYAAPIKEDVTLIAESLDNKPVRFEQSGSEMSIEYLAPEGFSSTLQSSKDMREWTILAKMESGDGEFHSFDLNATVDPFFRVVFEALLQE